MEKVAKIPPAQTVFSGRCGEKSCKVADFFTFI